MKITANNDIKRLLFSIFCSFIVLFVFFGGYSVDDGTFQKLILASFIFGWTITACYGMGRDEGKKMENDMLSKK